MVTTYDDFDRFGRAVQDLHSAHPDWIRLNGEETGGDQNPWGFFWHDGRKWKVDADTHFTPILCAYDYQRRTGENPFQITRTTSRDCLVVIDEVRSDLIRRDPKYRHNKYLYIYAPCERKAKLAGSKQW